MRILVTGGSGFVGRNVVAAAVSRGWAVMRMSRNASAQDPGELAMGPERWSRETFSAAIEAARPDAVLHLAGATVAVGHRELFEANALLSAIAGLDAPPRTILVGSAAEYGFVPESEQPAAERRPCLPVSNYGISK